MKLFVCVVHVEELQHYPFPAPEDWDAIQKIASGGGIFKSFTYAGLRPNYGDNVLVAFADPATRADGMFLHPLVGGATGGASAAPTGVGGGIRAAETSGRIALASCSSSPPLAAAPPGTNTNLS